MGVLASHTWLDVDRKQGIGTLSTALVAAVSVVNFACTPDVETAQPSGSAALPSASDAQIVMSDQRVWSDAGGWSVGDSVELSILDSAYYFHQVGDIAPLEDGRFVVENRGAYNLLVFDSLGNFVESWGGRGDGPTEFSRLMGVYPCEGYRVAAIDFAVVKLLASDGSLLDELNIPQPLIGRTNIVRGVTADCRNIFVTRASRELQPTPIGTVSTPWEAFIGSLDALRIDTLGTFPGTEYGHDPNWSFPGGGPVFPFGYSGNWAIRGSDVFYGWGDAPEIGVVSLTGEIRRVIRWSVARRPIAESEWSLYEAYRRDRLEGGLPAAAFFAREQHPHPDAPLLRAEAL